MKSKNSWKNILNRYRHAWVFLYGFIYMPWFMYLEKRPIPAHEYFIINFESLGEGDAVTATEYYGVDTVTGGVVKLIVDTENAGAYKLTE